MSNAYLDALKQRRTQYSLGRNLSISKEELTSLIQEAIKHSPSSFNSQSSRAVILFGAESEKLWNIAIEEVRKVAPAESFAQTEAKLKSFAAGVGTVLFFEDQGVVQGLQEKFALYADNFPVWSEQAGGMAQLSVWSTLASAGVGASLQHYNPLIDAAVAREWNVPAYWKLRAQMPFGSNENGFGEKAFMADAERFRVAGGVFGTPCASRSERIGKPAIPRESRAFLRPAPGGPQSVFQPHFLKIARPSGAVRKSIKACAWALPLPFLVTTAPASR